MPISKPFTIAPRGTALALTRRSSGSRSKVGTAGAGLRGQQVLHNAVGMSFWSISPREPNTSKSPTMSHCLWQERGIRSPGKVPAPCCRSAGCCWGSLQQGTHFLVCLLRKPSVLSAQGGAEQCRVSCHQWPGSRDRWHSSAHGAGAHLHPSVQPLSRPALMPFLFLSNITRLSSFALCTHST